jgi:hypothetical protein
VKYLVLDIAVISLGGDRYKISATTGGKLFHNNSSPPGNLPKDIDELQGAILRSATSARRDTAPGVPASESIQLARDYHACDEFIKSLGKQLFNFLFDGAIGECYRTVLDNANREGQSVRLNLQIEDSARFLASAPWESLYDPRLRAFLATRLDLQFMRTVGTGTATIHKPRSLHILGMIAAPATYNGRSLNVVGGKERDGIVGAIQPLERTGRGKLHWTQGGSLRDLQRGLRMRRSNVVATATEPWAVFHFIGHGDFDSERNLGFLLLEGDGVSIGKECYADVLASALKQPLGPQLVVLNACNGALSASGDIFNSTAAMLALSGIPAVVAMQFPVTDKTATEFAAKFYDELADGVSIQEALVNTRLHLRVNSCAEWVTPVLYLSGDDGELVCKPVD